MYPRNTTCSQKKVPSRIPRWKSSCPDRLAEATYYRWNLRQAIKNRSLDPAVGGFYDQPVLEAIQVCFSARLLLGVLTSIDIPKLHFSCPQYGSTAGHATTDLRLAKMLEASGS